MTEETISCCIIDDEQHCVATLNYEIERQCPQLKVVGTFTDPTKALELLKTDAPDLVFLDIEMPKLNGFELLKQLGDPSFAVIFTTAYDKFAVEAFKFSALDYLLKPVSSDELKQAVAKFEAGKDQNQLPDQLEILFRRMDGKGFNKIALPSSSGLEFVPPEEITHCDSQSNYTMVHFTKRKRILISRTLKEVEEMLEGQGFFRAHHSHLVNLNHVRQYVKGSGGYLVMQDDTHIPVSRSRKEELLGLFAR